MSCSASLGIAVFKGTHRSFILTFIDEEGELVDLTAWTDIEVQVKWKAGDADPPLIAKALGSGVTLLAQSGVTLGQARVDFVPDDTKLMVARVYKWDVIGIDEDGFRHASIPPSDFDLRDVVNLPPIP